MRQPRVGCWSPVLAHDGANLAATLATIEESDIRELSKVIDEAFPGSELRATSGSGFQLEILWPDLQRWMKAPELSDGTLRFFCLAAALLSPKPPPLLVLNEPETSLHPKLLPPLAGLISRVAGETQIIVVTHSELLADAIAETAEAKMIRLISVKGETRQEGQETGRRAWTFDD
jgi:predicted ATPase